jgi:cold shock CspA family protein
MGYLHASTTTHHSKGMNTMATSSAPLTSGAGFDRNHILFPENTPGDVFANDVAILMKLVMDLPCEGTTKRPAEVEAACDTAVMQFIETDSRAKSAGLLVRTSTSAQILVHLGYLMMSRLEVLRVEEKVTFELFTKACDTFDKLCGGLGADAFAEF